MERPSGEMPLSTTVPAVIAAALGLMSSYNDALVQNDVYASALVPSAQHERNQRHEQLAAAIHDVIKRADDMEGFFRRAVKQIEQRGAREVAEQGSVEELSNLLTSLRGIEVGLKQATVPEELSDLHVNVRRAVARARSWVAVVENQFRQAMVVPTVVPSQADGNALRALAEHSTDRLVQMARA